MYAFLIAAHAYLKLLSRIHVHVCKKNTKKSQIWPIYVTRGKIVIMSSGGNINETKKEKYMLMTISTHADFYWCTRKYYSCNTFLSNLKM